MNKPKSKRELLKANQESFDELNGLFSKLSDEEIQGTFPFAHRDKNVRDVFAHLLEWQKMMLAWYQIGMNGQSPAMPAEGYTWRETPALNAEIWERYQPVSLEDVLSKLHESHQELSKLVQSHSDRELSTKRLYPWTGSTSLGAYLTSAMTSHYTWANKLIKRVIRNRK